tara:strand:+ start:441 stop:671 length:231 start_codon:yes stop_codon:yes gene_type:complete
MTEEKSVRQLERELKQARIKEGAEQRSTVNISRDYSVVGIDPSTTLKNKTDDAPSNIPDVMITPKRKNLRSENVPF